MFYNCLYTLFRHKYLILVLLLWGCSSDTGDSPVVIEDDPDEVTVTFSAGNSSVLTRAPFSENTPLKIYVYRGSDFSVAPYKVVEGKTGGEVANGLFSVTLTGGDLTDDDRLTVRGGNTYNFVVVVNASSGATASNLGALSSGVLTGFSHGMDILAGKKTLSVGLGQPNVDVTFTEYGAVDGKLPHLCCAVLTEARATSALIDKMKKDGGGTFKYAVAGMDFKQCLPKSANLSFSGNPMALTVVGSSTNYSASILGEEKEVNLVSDVARSAQSILLPYPLRTETYNTLNIDFRLRINGGETLFEAPGIQAPPFEPGYLYRFIVEMDYEAPPDDYVIKLLLSVEPWSSVSWQSTMGGSEDTESLMLLSLGSWSSVSWQSAMGSGSTGSMLIVSVSGWSGVTWASHMGD
jgi:hypothetical protein